MKIILYICSVHQRSAQLRFIDEISEIEYLILTSPERLYQLKPKIGLDKQYCRRVINDRNEAPPYILHFSSHGDAKLGGLKFRNRNSDADSDIATADYFINLFKNLIILERYIECVFFAACHSYPIAQYCNNQAREQGDEWPKTHIKYIISVEGAIADDAILIFNKGFYQTLFDGHVIDLAFRMGKQYLRDWEKEEQIQPNDGKPFSDRIHMIHNHHKIS